MSRQESVGYTLRKLSANLPQDARDSPSCAEWVAGWRWGGVHLRVCESALHLCMWGCMHVCGHACVYACMWVYVCVHIHVCVCVCTCACMCGGGDVYVDNNEYKSINVIRNFSWSRLVRRSTVRAREVKWEVAERSWLQRPEVLPPERATALNWFLVLQCHPPWDFWTQKCNNPQTLNSPGWIRMTPTWTWERVGGLFSGKLWWDAPSF